MGERKYGAFAVLSLKKYVGKVLQQACIASQPLPEAIDAGAMGIKMRLGLLQAEGKVRIQYEATSVKSRMLHASSRDWLLSAWL